MTQQDFQVQDWVIDKAHGLGRITERQNGLYRVHIGAIKADILVPVDQAQAGALRRPASRDLLGRAIAVLRSRPDPLAIVSRNPVLMRRWSDKYHSGDPLILASIVRDLHPSSGGAQKNSPTRKALARAAMVRLAEEMALVLGIPGKKMLQKLDHLINLPRRPDAAVMSVPAARPMSNPARPGDRKASEALRQHL